MNPVISSLVWAMTVAVSALKTYSDANAMTALKVANFAAERQIQHLKTLSELGIAAAIDANTGKLRKVSIQWLEELDQDTYHGTIFARQEHATDIQLALKTVMTEVNAAFLSSPKVHLFCALLAILGLFVVAASIHTLRESAKNDKFEERAMSTKMYKKLSVAIENILARESTVGDTCRAFLLEFKDASMATTEKIRNFRHSVLQTLTRISSRAIKTPSTGFEKMDASLRSSRSRMSMFGSASIEASDDSGTDTLRSFSPLMEPTTPSLISDNPKDTSDRNAPISSNPIPAGNASTSVDRSRYLPRSRQHEDTPETTGSSKSASSKDSSPLTRPKDSEAAKRLQALRKSRGSVRSRSPHAYEPPYSGSEAQDKPKPKLQNISTQSKTDRTDSASGSNSHPADARDVQKLDPVKKTDFDTKTADAYASEQQTTGPVTAVAAGSSLDTSRKLEHQADLKPQESDHRPQAAATVGKTNASPAQDATKTTESKTSVDAHDSAQQSQASETTAASNRIDDTMTTKPRETAQHRPTSSTATEKPNPLFDSSRISYPDRREEVDEEEKADEEWEDDE